MKRKLFIVMTVGMIILFTIMPSVVSEGAKERAAVMVYGNSPVIASFYDFVRNIGEIKNHKIHKPFFKTTFWVSVWGK